MTIKGDILNKVIIKFYKRMFSKAAVTTAAWLASANAVELEIGTAPELKYPQYMQLSTLAY